MSRVYNFSAGPAVLPEEVLKEAAAEMLDYKGTGMSVMEMSHRSKAFEEIITTAEQDIRDLMGIPDNYRVLFLQGGASQQFAMIPMNLMKNRVADYIPAVCHDPDEPDEEPRGRLYHYGAVGKESGKRGGEIRQGQPDRFIRRQNVLLYPGLFGSSGFRRCGLCIHL